MKAYGIFQGGGAKGYAHVGALKAAEKRGISFVRYAGTSAGAIIATLAAAGYTADELLNPTCKLGERGVLDEAIGDLIDPGEYKRVQRLLRRLTHLNTISYPKAGPIGNWQQAKRNSALLYWPRALKFALLEARSVYQVYQHFGVVGTDPVVAWLDGLLSNKLGKSGQVTFADLGMRLKMVAANLTTGETEKFGFAGDEALPVAPAAVASACFPLFFRPMVRGPHMFLDGGLVSNLPVWLFDEERDDEASHLPTFGFRLVNDALIAKTNAAPSRFFPFSRRVVQTVLSGSRNLEERQIQYYHGIDLPVSVDTLSFDAARLAAPQLVIDSERCVVEYLAQFIGPKDPEKMQRVLSIAIGELIDALDWRGNRVRAHILLPDADARHATTIYSLNMADCPDDHLRVRTDVDGIGAVFRLREPVYADIAGDRPADTSVLKYEIGVRPPWVAGMYAIPIFDNAAEWSKPNPIDRPLPAAALVIDSDADFSELLLDPSEQDSLANVAAIIGEEIRDRTIVSEPRSPYALAGPPGWDLGNSSPYLELPRERSGIQVLAL